MAKLVLDAILSDYASRQKVNSNSDAIEAALENTLSRDGTAPNYMSADLDMNSHRILNLPTPTTDTEPVRLGDIAAGAILTSIQLITAHVDSIAALKAYTMSIDLVGKLIFVRGFATIGDGGEGFFRVTQTSPGNLDTGVNITSNTAGYYAVRQFSGDVNAKWYGAKGDSTYSAGTFGGTSYTTQLQNAMNGAYALNCSLFIPAGIYFVTALTQPGTAANRPKSWRMYGVGSGELFATTTNTIFSTVIGSNTATVLTYTPDSANTGAGNIEIDHIRFESTTANPVVQFGSIYAQSSFHHNGVLQHGTGNGVQSQLSNTIEMHNNYAMNGDWNTTVLGAARTGIGFYIYDTIATGLTTLRKNTSRGFKYGYKIGNASGTICYSFKLSECECSVNYTGIWLTSDARNCVVDSCYMEGGDQGTGVQDDGNYNTVRSTIIFSGFVIGIDSSLDTYGSNYIGNTLAAGSVTNTKLIKLNSNAANGGPGKLVSGNMLVFSGSGGVVAGVIAVVITGIDPRISLVGNMFDPRGNWVGGAGTTKISNQSTSGDGTTGSGLYGIGLSVSKDNTQENTSLARGGINLAVDQTALTGANVSANVLTIGQGSVFTMTAAGATTVNSIAADNLPDKTFMIYTTNANTTFANTATLKMTGSANYTPGANGAMITFQVFPVGVCREIARVAY